MTREWVERRSDVRRAQEIQQQLAPKAVPDLDGYDVAGRCVAAQSVGGDFYDWLLLPEALQLTVADVMGKGVPAALIAASVRAVLRAGAYFHDVETLVNRAAAGLLADLTETGTFATLFTARLDPATGDLAYVDAGHGLAVVCRADGTVVPLAHDDMPLGVADGQPWHAHRAHLGHGDTLLVVSDGILDLFTGTRDALAAARHVCAQAPSASALVERVTAFATARAHDDDVTVVAVRRHPDGSC